MMECSIMPPALLMTSRILPREMIKELGNLPLHLLAERHRVRAQDCLRLCLETQLLVSKNSHST